MRAGFLVISALVIVSRRDSTDDGPDFTADIHERSRLAFVQYSWQIDDKAPQVDKSPRRCQ